jgi:hypothetical protein
MALISGQIRLSMRKDAVTKSQSSSVRPPPNPNLCGLAVNGRSNLAATILWRINSQTALDR